MISRVGELSLRLRLPPELASRQQALSRAIADDLVVAVLGGLEARVHARFGPRAIVRIRSLPLAWRLELDELADPALIARLADELADALVEEIEALPRRERLRPRGERVAIFDDEDHAAAAFLADDADGRGDAWVHVARVAATATWRDAIARGAASVLAVVRWLERMERLDDAIAGQPAALVGAIAAAIPYDDQPAALRAAGMRDARDAAPSPAPRPPTAQPTLAPAIEPAHDVPAPRVEVGPRAAVPGARAIAASASAARPTRDRAIAPDPAQLADTPPARAVDPDQAAAAPPLHEVETEHAGLFYLIGRVIEIELAEHLWAAGVPEGDVLAHVAAAIVGADDDPAPRWFGGAFDRAPAHPDVPAWARDEINERVMHSLGRRLARFGVDTTPARLDATLVAIARAHAPVASLAPALASIVERSAAALTTIAAARLGVEPSAALTRAVCVRPGRLILADDRLLVAIPSACVDLDHRRAGLDHDPGRAPWLRRAVVFAFPGGDEL